MKKLHIGVKRNREKTSHLECVKFFHNSFSQQPYANVPISITTVRRQNVLSLFQIFAEERIAAGDQPKGLEAAFAQHLGVSGATWSMAKSGSRPIGDKLARQIEHSCAKEAGWLDEERAPQGLTAAEQQFLAVALKAWRSTNSDGRKRLRSLIKQFSAESAG